MFKIIDGLWQGGRPEDALPAEIEIVVSLEMDPPDYHLIDNRVVLWIPIVDAQFPGLRWLRDTILAIEALSHNLSKPVYIHCTAGISRSVMLTAAYLIQCGHVVTRDEALEHIAKVNPLLNPNRSFLSGLKDLENAVRSSWEACNFS